MFNLKFNVMKKIVFSLMTLFALALTAGSAMAQNETTVTQGGIYTYTLSGIVVNSGGEVSIDFDGDAAEDVAIISGFSSTSPTAPTGSYDGVFTVEFSNTAADGDLIVTVTDGAGCENSIFLSITVLPEPTINIELLASEDQYCQTTNNTTENEAASLLSTNSIDFTVTPTITDPPTNYTWGYTIAIPDPTLTNYEIRKGGSLVTLPLVVSGLASTVISETYTVTFETTTGAAPKSLEGTVTLVTLTETTGGGVYAETDLTNNVATVNVKSTPSIGSFQ